MAELKFIKINRVIDRVGMSKSHLYAQIAKKRFPAPIKLGVRSSAWLESEVEEWMEERTAESRSEESKKAAPRLRDKETAMRRYMKPSRGNLPFHRNGGITPPRRIHARQGYQLEALHEYTDRHGFPLYSRVRLSHPAILGKWIRPMRLDGDSYVFGEPEFLAGKPLYRLHHLHLRPDEVVYLVEGEKCADRLEQLGLLAITSGGADSFEIADFRPLAGRKVVLWRDNDEAGKRWIDGVTRKLQRLGCKLQHGVIDELALPEKGDCVDWLEANPTVTAAAISSLRTIMPEPESAAEAIARLAALPPLEYDEVRKDEAQILGIRSETLDKEVREARAPHVDESPFNDPGVLARSHRSRSTAR